MSKLLIYLKFNLVKGGTAGYPVVSTLVKIHLSLPHLKCHLYQMPNFCAYLGLFLDFQNHRGSVYSDTNAAVFTYCLYDALVC